VIATLGNFDGVHLGHQQMIKTLVERAKEANVPSMVIVFEPQPLEFLSDNPPARLTTFHEKSVIFKQMGVSQIHCLEFNQDLALMSPEDFIQSILSESLHIQHLVVGDDVHFGHQKRGDLALLQALGPQYGFTTEGLGSIMVGSERVSSTAVREALKAGNLARAEQLLGHPYSIRGVVQAGDQRGRLMGYPTANIDPARVKVPLTGVFAVKVLRHCDAKNVRHCEPQAKQSTTGMDCFVGVPPRNDEIGMANLGTRPTIGGLKTLLEVNIFDFNESIYGQEIEVEFCHKIRDEQRFESMEALIAQIKADKLAVESYFHHG
jgi:riboflavin kinase/FMN adenylyltransferase